MQSLKDTVQNTASNVPTYTPVATAICAGVILSIVLLLSALRFQYSSQRLDFESKVIYKQRMLKEHISLCTQSLESIEGLFAASDNVDRGDFHEFTKRISSERAGIMALDWVPRVPYGERTAYEQQARKDGVRGFQFTEQTPDKRLVRAGTRTEYYPVYYVEPHSETRIALGYDMASNPARRIAMEEARDTGQPAATKKVSLIHAGNNLNGFLLFVPIYKNGTPHSTVEQRRQNLKGFTVGAFIIDDLVNAALRNAPKDGIDMEIYSASVPTNEGLLGTYKIAAPMEASSSIFSRLFHVNQWFTSNGRVIIGLRKWHLRFHSNKSYESSIRSSDPWLGFAVSLLFTAMMATYIFSTSNRSRQIEVLNTELNRENAERKKAEKEISENENRLRVILDSVRPGIMTIDAETHEIVDANTAALHLIGAPRETVIGSVCHKFICPAALGQCPITDLGLVVDNSERILIQADGNRIPIIKNVTRIDLGNRSYLLESFVDIRDLKEAQETLRQNERFLSAIFHGIQDGIAVLDTDMTVVRMNDAAVRHYTGGKSAVGKKCFEALFNRSEQCEICPAVRAMEHGDMQSNIISMPCTATSKRWVEMVAFPLFHDNGEVRGVINYLRDITEKRLFEERLDHLAHHDPLTDLPNRLEFGNSLRRKLEQAANVEHSLAVLFVDLDRFKSINDTLGHDFGDQLLQVVSKRLQSAIRDSDVIARMGGDEFTIILDNVMNRDEVEIIAQRLLDSFSQHFSINMHEIQVTASLGISLFPEDGTIAEDLVMNADIAMYRAKEEGRNNYQFYIKAVDSLLTSKVDMQNSLRRSIERGELLVHYQPQLDVRKDRIHGLEVLVRWRHPELGLVMPDKFIPLAEEIGFIGEITRFVLFTACQQAKFWSNNGLPSIDISVNISAEDLKDDTLIEIVRETLLQTKLDPKYLTLEITESALVRKPETAIDTIQKLKHLGVGVSIDDFGTRYASLSLLKQFPVDYLKIDRSFVKHVDTNINDGAIVESVISMAHKLGLRVVAEGVETTTQLEILKELRCDTIQGYLLSRPVSADEMLALLMVDADRKSWK